MKSDAKEARAAMPLPDPCPHFWVAEHKPNHLVYWVRQCSLCHKVDWDDLDNEVAKLLGQPETTP